METICEEYRKESCQIPQVNALNFYAYTTRKVYVTPHGATKAIATLSVVIIATKGYLKY